MINQIYDIYLFLRYNVYDRKARSSMLNQYSISLYTPLPLTSATRSPTNFAARLRPYDPTRPRSRGCWRRCTTSGDL